MAATRSVTVHVLDSRTSNINNSTLFSEKIEGSDLQSLRQAIQCMQTKMNNWLTAQIEDEKASKNANEPSNGINMRDNDDDEEDDDVDDDDDDDSEPPLKQQKT